MKQQLRQELLQLSKHSIVMISGFGGAGKSTLAQKISSILPCQVITIDDFFTDIELYHYWNCFEYERFIRDVITPYKARQESTYKAYNWNDPSKPIQKTLELSDYLIIEGVGLFRDTILEHVDYTIWVDTPIEEAVDRGKYRDKQYGVNFDYLWDGIWKNNDIECFERHDPISKANHIHQEK